MMDRIKKTFQEAADALREQAAHLGEGAKERSFQVIEEWLSIFPRLEGYGLELSSFAISVALSPALEAELTGQHEHFTTERLQEILSQCKGNAALTSVFTTIKTTYALHERTTTPLRPPLIVKIKVRLSPEIKVYLGVPLIE